MLLTKQGTINQQLIFKSTKSTLSLTGFSDADWANSQERKNITGSGFMISNEGLLILWKTRKQSTVALFTCEAEYISISAAAQEGKYLKALMKDMLNNEINYTFILYCDSQSGIALTKIPINHQRSKHIDIKFHFIRNEFERGTQWLFHKDSEKNIAVIFTKPVNRSKKEKFINLLMGLWNELLLFIMIFKKIKKKKRKIMWQQVNTL